MKCTPLNITLVILLFLLISFSVSVAQESKVVGQIESLGNEIATSLAANGEWRLAVMDFLIYNEELSEKGVDVAAVAILEAALADKGIQLIERRKLAEVLEEIRLGMTGLLDASTVAEAGMLLGANGMIMGSMTEIGNSIVINVKLVEVETSEIRFTSFVTVNREELIQEAEKYVVFVGGERSLILAGLGSALIPGVGQIYAKRTVKGVVLFSLVAAGLILYGNQVDQAEGFYANLETNSDKYSQSFTLSDIEIYRQAMEESRQNYQDALMSADDIGIATTLLYVYGIVDAIMSARKFNKEMKEKYEIGLLPQSRGVLVYLGINF